MFKADIRLRDPQAQSLLRVSRQDPTHVPDGRPFVLLRVHAACCGTPLFNTWRELPTCSFFAAVAAPDGGSGAAALLQPPQWRLNTRWATAPAGSLLPAGSDTFSPLFLLRFMARNFVYFRSRAEPAPFELPSDLEACEMRDDGGKLLKRA